jgi:hypothetical protein
VATLTEALDAVEPSVGPEEKRCVWTATGRDTVTDRMVAFVDGADEKCVHDRRGPPDSAVARSPLGRERGVLIRLVGTSAPAASAIREAVPEVTVFDSL